MSLEPNPGDRLQGVGFKPPALECPPPRASVPPHINIPLLRRQSYPGRFAQLSVLPGHETDDVAEDADLMLGETGLQKLLLGQQGLIVEDVAEDLGRREQNMARCSGHTFGTHQCYKMLERLKIKERASHETRCPVSF